MIKNAYKSLLATTAATTALLALAGCSSSTAPTGNSSAANPQGSATVVSSSNADSGATSSASTPATALAAWVSDVVEGDYLAACSKMALPADGTATGTPVPGTAALCTKPTKSGTTSATPESIIKDLHPSFTPKSLSGQPSVTVVPVTAAGSDVTVDAKQISIDGTPLVQVIAANSTGVTAAQLQVTFALTRLNGSWYVSNFNLNV